MTDMRVSVVFFLFFLPTHVKQNSIKIERAVDVIYAD